MWRNRGRKGRMNEQRKKDKEKYMENRGNNTTSRRVVVAALGQAV
jgi:hypothetical protein